MKRSSSALTTHAVRSKRQGHKKKRAHAIPPGHELAAGVDTSDTGETIPRGCLLAGVGANGYGWNGGAPQRDGRGSLHFGDHPDFQPNLTPAEVLRAGSFGGGYFRPIFSSVTGTQYSRVSEELPEDWINGLDIETHIASETNRARSVNKYRVDCGARQGKADQFGQLFWESKGWIDEADPYGWFMWYCRFYQGRRSHDDHRQISRWQQLAGVKGRWKQNLVAKCYLQKKSFDDISVSPVVRQTLQHWAYRLTKEDYQAGLSRVKTNGASYVPRAKLAKVRGAE
jgi:hypothetical protein